MLRTISESINELKKADPDTAVTVYLIRQLAKAGAIQSIKSGKKYIINLRSLQAYLGIEPKKEVF